MIGEYNLQIKNRLINRGENDKDDCRIRSIRMLPDGNILLLDESNLKLKKLDISYNVVSHCDIFPLSDSSSWIDVCYIGNDRAVVCCDNGRIQYVNVLGKMKLDHDVKLDHNCLALACHGDTLYASGGDAIYTYTIHCQGKHLLYNIKVTDPLFSSRIAISDDGERIYIANGTEGLITIDNKGNCLFTLKPDTWYLISDVCVVGDGTLLLLDGLASVHQVEYSGKQVLGTVVDQSYILSVPTSLCFDRQRCRLIVSTKGRNIVYVFMLQHHNSELTYWMSEINN
ncbi:uncharacterized protein LOC128552216 [Mercenaria mercenaria]|uniref:uncharacterized protein LOC128552216 n=1 Tax=Mercenaria mercenaria TaxID=6596 RepID=UPI00234FA170|nr:uncharacterized protein LOC128552216 [Mercenaria mercenaria]